MKTLRRAVLSQSPLSIMTEQHGCFNNLDFSIPLFSVSALWSWNPQPLHCSRGGSEASNLWPVWERVPVSAWRRLQWVQVEMANSGSFPAPLPGASLCLLYFNGKEFPDQEWYWVSQMMTKKSQKPFLDLDTITLTMSYGLIFSSFFFVFAKGTKM